MATNNVNIKVNLSVEKPPLGVVPKRLWIEQRKLELRAGIKRYLSSENKITIEWIEELNSYL